MAKQQQQHSICVDIDGTLLSYDRWRGQDHFGDAIDGAVEFMQRFREAGWHIILLTARLADSVVAEDVEGNGFDRRKAEIKRKIAKAMNDRGFKGLYDAIEGKPLAIAYIDDRGFNCDPEGFSDPRLVYWDVHQAVGRRRSRTTKQSSTKGKKS